MAILVLMYGYTATGAQEEVYWGLADHQGTIRDVSTGYGGLVQVGNHSQYKTFGQSTSSTSLMRYIYTGRDCDTFTDLQYNRARWYDPATGRFISQDPIGFEAGDANLYRYVGNGPMTKTDPSGFDEIEKINEKLDKLIAKTLGNAHTSNASKSKEDVHERGTTTKITSNQRKRDRLIAQAEQAQKDRMAFEASKPECKIALEKVDKLDAHYRKEIDRVNDLIRKAKTDTRRQKLIAERALYEESMKQVDGLRVLLKAGDVAQASKILGAAKFAAKVGGKGLVFVGVATSLGAGYRGFNGDGFRPEGGAVGAFTEVGREVCEVEKVNGWVESSIRWVGESLGIGNVGPYEKRINEANQPIGRARE
jgi:RHS repeat-associated protein